MWSDTRWESKIKSVEPLSYQTAKVRDALIEVRNHTKDSVLKVDAHCLSEEVGLYHFAIFSVVWYDLLCQIQHVSRQMQSPWMHVDVAVNFLKRTERDLHNYRATDFVAAQMAATDICKQMNVEAVLKKNG